MKLLASSTAIAEKRWLAGDHHIHSQFSPGYDDNVDPSLSGQHINCK
jgi:hypothetical protein